MNLPAETVDSITLWGQDYGALLARLDALVAEPVWCEDSPLESVPLSRC